VDKSILNFVKNLGENWLFKDNTNPMSCKLDGLILPLNKQEGWVQPNNEEKKEEEKKKRKGK
jgi:hypothetical protein